MAWPSTRRNQLPSCLALLKSSNLFPVSIAVMSLGQTFNFLINLRFWEPHWTLTSPWNPISKLYPVPASTKFDRSSKFVHPCIMTWQFLWLCRGRTGFVAFWPGSIIVGRLHKAQYPRPWPRSLKSFRLPWQVQRLEVSVVRRSRFALHGTYWSSNLQPGARCRPSQHALDLPHLVLLKPKKTPPAFS